MDAAAVHRRRWWALAVMCISLLVITLDNTILNVAVPALIRDTHASTSQLQWVIDGYTLVFAGLLLTTGAMGDRFGRRGALTAGLVVFGVGSLFSGGFVEAGAHRDVDGIKSHDADDGVDWVGIKNATDQKSQQSRILPAGAQGLDGLRC